MCQAGIAVWVGDTDMEEAGGSPLGSRSQGCTHKDPQEPPEHITHSGCTGDTTGRLTEKAASHKDSLATLHPNHQVRASQVSSWRPPCFSFRTNM